MDTNTAKGLWLTNTVLLNNNKHSFRCWNILNKLLTSNGLLDTAVLSRASCRLDVCTLAVFCTWRLSQRSRWRWPCRHTADTIPSLCAQSGSSDTPGSVYPRSRRNRQRKKELNRVRDTLVSSNNDREKTGGLQKVINVGHGEKGTFSQRRFCPIYPHCSEHSAPPWSCVSLHNNMHTKNPALSPVLHRFTRLHHFFPVNAAAKSSILMKTRVP